VAGITFKVSRKFEGQQAAILDKLRARYDQITAAEAERPSSSGELSTSTLAFLFDQCSQTALGAWRQECRPWCYTSTAGQQATCSPETHATSSWCIEFG
jgi:hypothetical protein